MNKWYIKKIDGQDFIYHSFSFDPEIQKHVFIGEKFLGMDHISEVRNLRAFDRVVDAGPNNFFPELVEELKKIFGEGNYVYDGYEIGEDVFSLYFFIKAKLYKQLLKKVELWSKYREFEDLIYWEEKK